MSANICNMMLTCFLPKIDNSHSQQIPNNSSTRLQRDLPHILLLKLHKLLVPTRINLHSSSHHGDISPPILIDDGYCSDSLLFVYGFIRYAVQFVAGGFVLEAFMIALMSKFHTHTHTHPKTNLKPKNWRFVDVSPFPRGYFQVPVVSFRGL